MSHIKHHRPLVSKRTILALVSMSLALPLWIGSVALLDVIERYIVSERARALTHVLDQDRAYAVVQAKSAAESEPLRAAIARKDHERTLVILDAEMRRRELGTMVAVDRDGVALARVPAIGSRGDLVGLTQPWGRAAQQGEAVVMVGRGRTFPLVMIAAAPIMEKDVPRGAIFAGYRLDSSYAASIAERVPEGTEILFYTSDDGMVGTSFRGSSHERLLEGFFNIGSAWLHEGASEAWIEIEGTRYFVKNMPFPDPDELEGNVGGVLLLVRVPWEIEVALPAVFVALCLTLFASLVLASSSRPRAIRFIALATIFLFSLGVLLWASASRLNGRTIPVVAAPYVIYNSTMQFVPGANMIDLASEQRVAIQLDSGGEAINAIEAVVRFDPRRARVEELLTTNSLCSEGLFIERTIDNVAGIVSIVCGIPSPGFTGSRGIVAEILLQPLAEGMLALTFDHETKVLANDGLGTNVLRQASDAAYQVRATSIASGIMRSTAVFSPTHPNAARWYDRQHARFLWPIAEGTRYFYAWDQNPSTIPSPGMLAEGGSIDVNAGRDGEYFFHLVAERAGIRSPVAHVRVRVDVSPPAPPTIRVSERKVSVGDIVRFQFSSLDVASGLQPNYYVNIDHSIFLPTLPSVYVPFLDPGAHEVSVRVFDRAGNSSDASTEIIVIE